ncbi:MAG: hypothetical protein KF901_22555 [Myxococcales bacterium]|nr:hypothetical protein [Myxococcales bacterium]
MNEVRKSFEVRGRDPLDLERRVERFREAICARRGAVLAVTWGKDGTRAAHAASVLYQLPISALRADAHP